MAAENTYVTKAQADEYVKVEIKLRADAFCIALDGIDASVAAAAAGLRYDDDSSPLIEMERLPDGTWTPRS